MEGSVDRSFGADLQKAQRAEGQTDGMKYSNWAGHKPHPWASFWCLVRVSSLYLVPSFPLWFFIVRLPK